MKILGIETTCDDTSIAIVENGIKILSCKTASQQTFHKNYNGIVPEVASRMHLELLLPTLHQALQKSNTQLSEIKAIAVSSSPGLMGALLVGVHSAKALAYALQVPLVPVNHLLAHLYSITMACGDDAINNKRLHFPQLTLLASGGHTLVAYVIAPGKAKVLASTTDDAAGECFDKVGKHLQLAFPGGPAIEKIATLGNASAYNFPTSLTKKNAPLSFTFSGLKTAVVHHAEKYKRPGAYKKSLEKNDIAASFQNAVVEQLVNKTLQLFSKHKTNHIGVCGGVACNKRLRSHFKKRLHHTYGSNAPLLTIPNAMLCSDNAAMVAGLGFCLLKEEKNFFKTNFESSKKMSNALSKSFFSFSPSSKKIRTTGSLQNFL